jgi:hypothetical protein
MRSKKHATEETRDEPNRQAAQRLARSVEVTVDLSGGPETMGPAGLLRLQRLAGNNAINALMPTAADRPETAVQREQGAVATLDKPAVLAEPSPEVAAAEKDDDVLAEGIFDEEHEILNQWAAALDVFDKVLESSSDKATRPDFKKVVVEFFKDKIIGELAKKSNIHGASEAIDLLKKLEDEVKRAEAAKESADLRDFYVQHKRAVADLEKAVIGMKSNFVTWVRKTPKSQHALMRNDLVTLFEDVDTRFKATNQESLYRSLSEAWIAGSTTTAISTKVPAFIVIRVVGRDLKVVSAEIKGPGGQKIAEQLLKDSPDGVDLISMAVPRNILWFRSPEDMYFSAVVKLDADSNLINEGSYIEGNYMPLYTRIMGEGLEPAKKVTGD